MPSLMTYLQGHLLAIIAPILLFGIIAVLSCTCWSCGMLACCAGGNGKPRKCCGKCCANPPKWTEGPMEWILMGVTLFLGVVVVGLAIKGLAVNKVQNDAVVKLGGSITLLEGWMTTSQSAVQNMTVNFDLVQKEVTEMKPTFDKWNVNTGQGLQLVEVYDEAPIFGEKGEDRIFGKFCEGNGLGNGHLYTDPNDSTNPLEKFTSYSHGAIRTFLQKRDGPSADLGARTDEVFDVCYVITKSRMIYTDMAKGVVSAREQTDKIETNIASLGDSIDSMGGMTESLEPINSTRNLALKSIWILLVSLMILELCIAFFRQLAPQMTSHCFARFLFGFVTFFYLFVLFILFLVLTVIVVVTVLFGDICKSPDETIVGLIGGAMGGGDDDANTNGLVFTPAPTAAPAATGGASAASNAVTDSLVATSSGGAGVDDGAQLMSYFITCDTDETQNNTFNAIATEAFDYFGVGVTEFNNLYQPFANKTEGFETRKNTSTSTATGMTKTFFEAFEADATAMKSQMASLRVPFYALVESITGQKDGVTDVDVPKQGMQDGLFKIVNCYQVNSRYQAVIGMMCG